jgi:excisionase family DNA binding protein
MLPEKGGSAMLNADELAAKLRVSRKQVQLLAERREIPFYRLGPRSLRFDEEEVMRAVKVKPDWMQKSQEGS